MTGGGGRSFSSISEVLTRHAQERPTDVALVAAERGYTYAELCGDVHAFARGLVHLGVGRGSTVALLCTNRAEWVVAALGTIVAGGQVAALNTWSRKWDLDHLLRDSGCEVLVSLTGFGDTKLEPLLRDLLPEAFAAEAPGSWQSATYPRLRELVLVGAEARPAGIRTLQDVLSTGASAPAGTEPPASSREDTALILYTSGSTARPKAVPLQQGVALEHGFDVGVRMGVTREDRIWLSVPLFWSYGGANALMVSLTHGCCLVLQETFDADEAIELIERHGCTLAYTLPNITAALTSAPGFSRARVATLRKGITIGSKRDVVAAATELGIGGVCNAYGSTEIYGGCCVTPHDWPLEKKAVSQGPPLPRIQVAIRDAVTGSVLPPGEVGEITVAGQVTPGYLNSPEENSRAFSDRGEYRSGDLGHVDAEGNLFFAARATEMIKSGGINIAPAEVEEFLLTHPQVVEAAVVGVADEKKGEVPIAYVRVAEAAGIEERDLKAFCRAEIASFKVPARIVVSDRPFPTTDTGKLARSKLREQAAAVWPGSRAPT